MSRREEVEATLSTWSGLEAGIQLSARRELCRTLADEVDALTVERDEWKRRLDAVVDLIKPAQIKWGKLGMDSPEYHAWCLVAPLYGQAIAIAEGRDNG